MEGLHGTLQGMIGIKKSTVQGLAMPNDHKDPWACPSKHLPPHCMMKIGLRLTG